MCTLPHDCPSFRCSVLPLLSGIKTQRDMLQARWWLASLWGWGQSQQCDRARKGQWQGDDHPVARMWFVLWFSQFQFRGGGSLFLFRPNFRVATVLRVHFFVLVPQRRLNTLSSTSSDHSSEAKCMQAWNSELYIINVLKYVQTSVVYWPFLLWKGWETEAATVFSLWRLINSVCTPRQYQWTLMVVSSEA